MEIKKEYTREGIKLTHPAGVIAITTITALRRIKAQTQERIKKSEEMLQQIAQDIIGLLNAGAK